MTEQKGEYNIAKLRQEFAALRKYAAMQAAQEEKIGVQKVYVDITGDIKAAFVLDELIFWTLPRDNRISGLRVWKNGVLWLAVERSEWWDRKRLTKRQADRAIENLIKQDLVIKQIHKFNGTNRVHLRLNVSVFFEKYARAVLELYPPEDENDTITKDLEDLYEMMGFSGLPNGKSPNGELPNGDGGLPNGYSELPNGDFLNIPHTSPTHPPQLENNPPSIEWAILAGKPVTEDMLNTLSENDMKDAAWMIAQGSNADLEPLAIAFMQARQIAPSNTEAEIKKWRRAFREMKQARPNPVRAEDVTKAVNKLLTDNMTVSDPWGVVKTAKAIANPAPEQGGMNPQGLAVNV